MDTIEVVAALIFDRNGQVLLVRKRGTEAFMQPGGKRDAGEDDVAALSREIEEEIGCRLVPTSIRMLGEFDAVAANEPDCRVCANLYVAEVIGQIVPNREIDEVIWVDPSAASDLVLAPLTRDHVLPIASCLWDEQLIDKQNC
ncbi:NUDIX hydrolase [Bradyrhizobium oligotrophicum]|nr:NUDIX domain-containing protein [Bradyrhizobium oligotrophicum]